LGAALSKLQNFIFYFILENISNLNRMQHKIFTIPLIGGEHINDEMNAFIRANKTLNVEKQLLQTPNGWFWAFCIQFTQGQNNNSNYRTEKIDYMQILTGKPLELFNKLKEIRKQLAQKDGIPVYAIFSNDELAGIAQLPEITPANIKNIKGIGQNKVKSYANTVCTMLNPVSDEKSGQLF